MECCSKKYVRLVSQQISFLNLQAESQRKGISVAQLIEKRNKFIVELEQAIAEAESRRESFCIIPKLIPRPDSRNEL